MFKSDVQIVKEYYDKLEVKKQNPPKIEYVFDPMGEDGNVMDGILVAASWWDDVEQKYISIFINKEDILKTWNLKQ